MSGGHLDYFYSDLESHVGDFGDRELDDLVKDMAALFYEREWFLSGDTCEGRWNEARDAFKRKWFTDGARAERIVKYLEDIKQEVLKSFGLSDEYCLTCEYWTQEQDENSSYGDCSETSGCLMHRHEYCEKYRRKLK